MIFNERDYPKTSGNINVMMNAADFWMMSEQMFINREINSIHYEEHPLSTIPIIFLTVPVNTIMMLPVIFSILRSLSSIAVIKDLYRRLCGVLLKGVDYQAGD